VQKLIIATCCKIGKFFTSSPFIHESVKNKSIYLYHAIKKYSIFLIPFLMRKEKPIEVFISIRILKCIQVRVDVRAN